MKTKLLSVVIICLNFSLNAQNTYVPDDNFEQYLIELGVDSGPLDDYVLTESIDTITHLTFEINSYNPEIITGLQDFIALEYFQFNNNIQFNSLDFSNSPNLKYINLSNGSHLTNINITQNLRLKYLNIYNSDINTLNINNNDSLLYLSVLANQQLSSLNISNNLQLETFRINNSDFNIDISHLSDLKHIKYTSALDLSQNLKLESVEAIGANLQTLDLSHNTLLTHINLKFNELTYLNVQNGNNSNILDVDFKINSNPNLTCVMVDDPYFSSQNWFQLDPQSYFSNFCTAGTIENEDLFISFFPNPVQNYLNISVNQAAKYFITSIDGKQVKVGELYSGENTLNTDELNNGLYIINVETKNDLQTFKINKQ